MFSSATQPPRHNFVVSSIIFEGFKLRSSNLTHALFIQISRTSSITDIVVQSKMAAGGHFVKKIKKKIGVSSWNGKNCDRKLFWDMIQNGMINSPQINSRRDSSFTKKLSDVPHRLRRLSDPVWLAYAEIMRAQMIRSKEIGSGVRRYT